MSHLKGQAEIMFYVGCVIFFVSGGMMAGWAIFAENIAYKTRIEYFKACLEKDAAFYDVNLPTTFASKISAETAAVQRGLGDKISKVLEGIAGFLLGFAFSFYWGWKYTLILLVVVPVMAVVGGFMGSMMEAGMVESMKAYAQSAGYAEQALNAIRVVHTYGQELLEYGNYTKFLERSR